MDKQSMKDALSVIRKISNLVTRYCGEHDIKFCDECPLRKYCPSV